MTIGFLRRRIARLATSENYLFWLKLWLGRLVFWGGAVGVGLLAGLFAALSETVGSFFAREAGGHVWLPLVIMPLGGATLVWLTRRYFAGAEGSGIPQVLAELRRAAPESAIEGSPPGKLLPLPRPLLSLRILTGKMFLGVSALGCGFPLGREGPSVQIGASLMNAVHRWLPPSLDIRRNHILIAGGAAGIAAAFNAPLAGVMFAIEELARGVESRMSGLVITAIILAGVTAQAMRGGSGNYFGTVLMIAGDQEQLKAVLVASVICGISGGCFSRIMLIGATAWRGRLANFRARSPVLFAGGCGFFIALLGIATGGMIFGSGLAETRALLSGEGELSLGFAPAKFVATLTAYLSGLPGGIFSPSLSIGAGLGVSLAPWLEQGAASGLLLTLCMAGFLAAATQAPMTSFLIVMEMVDGYSVVIALMTVSLFSSMVSRLLSPPLYATLARAMLRAGARSP
ncbi:MAG: chloride channel protein [Zoogloeaceae bacterium]|jgi:H+/Cl- antiporter ClcA|nr:chloride channel protein [Zoogloeaceae bacterium]